MKNLNELLKDGVTDEELEEWLNEAARLWDEYRKEEREKYGNLQRKRKENKR